MSDLTYSHDLNYTDDLQSFRIISAIFVKRLAEFTLEKCPGTVEMMEFYNSLSPERITERSIFEESCWIIYSSGFSYDIVRKYWPHLKNAFHEFEVVKVAHWNRNLELWAQHICVKSGFSNLRKAIWCIQNAKRLIYLESEMSDLGGLKGYFKHISQNNLRDITNLAPYVVQELGFKGIGGTTIFHLMKNIGIRVFKPDIHLRRILTKLGLIVNEKAPTPEICEAMLFLSSAANIDVSDLDTLLFNFGRTTNDCIELLF